MWQRQGRGGHLLRRLIDSARADEFVEGPARINRTAVGTAAEGQLVPKRSGSEGAGHGRFDFVIATRVVRAAEIIDVITPFGTEVVGHRLPCAAGRTVATPRKGTVVINDHATARRTEAALPVVIEAVFETSVDVQRVDTDRIGPVLVTQQFARRGIVRQRGAAQKLITGHRALLFALVLDIELQQGALTDVPVERQRGKIALAIGVFDIRTNVFMGKVGAQAELLFTAEPATDVGRDVAFAVFVGRDRDRPDVLRPLGLIVDYATGLGHAALQAGKPLEQLDLLLVLQRDVLLAGNAATVDAITVGGVQRKPAHHKVFVIAHRGIAVSDRRIVAQYLTQQLCLTIPDQRSAEHRHRGGRIQQ